ncbi:MAG: thiolase family protein, partial [Candidatus Hodarchaeales archaeon]
MENLTHYPMGIDFQVGFMYPVDNIYTHMSEERMADLQQRMSFTQGESAELVAEKYDISREAMDKFALWSHQKGTIAMRDNETYEKRVVPFDTRIEDPDGSFKDVTVTED